MVPRAAISLLLCAAGAHALYFYVVEGQVCSVEDSVFVYQYYSCVFVMLLAQTRCFLEDIPDDVMVVGTYKNPDVVPFGSPSFTGVVSRIIGVFTYTLR
jgi:hypothetical protein